MIVPVLKRILVRGEPDNKDDFVLAASADIGTNDSPGVDYFYFRIMTTKRLQCMIDEDLIIDGRATFIVKEFDLSIVEKEINKILNDCIRPTWDDVTKAINRHLSWEYDNIHYETFDEAMARLHTEES